LLRERRIDGAIVLDFGISLSELVQYSGPQLPVVVLNRSLPAPLASAYITGVRIDDDGGGYLAGKHLIEQGFLRPAVITGPIEAEASQSRQRGFFQAYAEHGIDPTNVPVIHSDFTESGGAQAMETLLNLGGAIDAIFSANDEMALGVLQTLATYGISVDQIAVMGFDDIPLARYVQPPLTTVHQPMSEVGATAMELLGRAMHGEERIPPRTLSTSLVVRASTPSKARPQ
jgi:LacI family transcriptional regulator